MPQTMVLSNGKVLTVDDDDSRADVLSAIKILDPEGSYKEALKANAELKLQDMTGGERSNWLEKQGVLFGQGLSFGLEDELASGLRSLWAAATTDESFDDAYARTHAEHQAYNQWAKEDTNLVNRIVAEYGLPAGLVGKAIQKGGKWAFQKLLNKTRKASPADVKRLVEDMSKGYGATGKLARNLGDDAVTGTIKPSTQKIAQTVLDQTPHTGIRGGISKIGQTGAVTVGTPVATGTILGATKAEPGFEERAKGAATGAVLGKNIADRALESSPANLTRILEGLI